jgi:hypothetical protein
MFITFKRLRSSILAAALGLTALLLSGCGGDSNGTATGPESGTAFAGAVISFNPTITFTSGTTFSWSNDNGDVAALVITDGAPVTGTFSYVPSSDFRTGTLTFTFDDPQIPQKQLNLSNFNGSATGITSFTISIESLTYNGRVLNTGTALLPKITITVGGGGSGGGTIANGTTYNGTLGAAVESLAFGPNSASLNPATLPTGTTSFRVATDRSQVRFNNITAGIQVGTSIPGVGGTGTYVLSTSASAVKTFIVIFDNNGVPVSAAYDSIAISGDFQSQRGMRQEITGIAVAP